MRIKNLPSILSMDGSQDALVIEQTDGSEDKSRKVSPAQIKQYVLGNSIDDIYSVMGQNGAKNLIPYPYYDPSGRTNRGITYTYDKDGIITANGSTDANNQSYLNLADFSQGLVLPSNKKYTLTCEKTNDNNKGFAVLYFKNADNTAKTVSTHVVYEDGTTLNVNRDYVSLLYNNVAHTSATFWVDTDTIYIAQARIHTNSGTITNAVLKPMLRLASDTDNTYQPYAKTNRQLTDELDTAREQIASVNSQLTNLPTAMATGKAAFPAAVIGGQDIEVQFPAGRFTSAPIVTVTMSDTSPFNVGSYMEADLYVYNVTKNSFWLHGTRKNANYTWYAHWIAVQM